MQAKAQISFYITTKYDSLEILSDKFDNRHKHLWTYMFCRLATFGATLTIYFRRCSNDKGFMCFTSLWQSNWQFVHTPCSIRKSSWKSQEF